MLEFVEHGEIIEVWEGRDSTPRIGEYVELGLHTFQTYKIVKITHRRDKDTLIEVKRIYPL